MFDAATAAAIDDAVAAAEDAPDTAFAALETFAVMVAPALLVVLYEKAPALPLADTAFNWPILSVVDFSALVAPSVRK